MIYTLIILIITAALITLSVLAVKQSKLSKILVFVNLSLAVAGACTMLVSHLIATNKIDYFISDTGFYSWAIDFYNLYYMIAMPAFILLLIINVLASLIGLYDGKQRTGLPKTLRTIVSISSSVFLMLIPFYGLITKNSNVEFYTYIMASGIGQALIIRIADMIGLIKTKPNSHDAPLTAADAKGKLK
ncbi:MAG: hypothetical protein J6L96_08235 [Clostridia bacterium]|nr:hypothetical protein [Clostridia bacterium]